MDDVPFVACGIKAGALCKALLSQVPDEIDILITGPKAKLESLTEEALKSIGYMVGHCSISNKNDINPFSEQSSVSDSILEMLRSDMITTATDADSKEQLRFDIEALTCCHTCRVSIAIESLEIIYQEVDGLPFCRLN
ncbi:hypothetical protein [Vibrio sp. SCSIO 43136]|uniref:hypothetical protein n=1 Tax=Vibrio sp. SCSIO 43136 TaxID=2819101 RepID=UPI0020765110|nr:hypothetical protein [Vibrio sp. SCSIO 43136]USD67888.1 hypothetical protein J4N39_17030 [Vibrio sp. SCSIO 43136]